MGLPVRPLTPVLLSPLGAARRWQLVACTQPRARAGWARTAVSECSGLLGGGQYLLYYDMIMKKCSCVLSTLCSMLLFIFSPEYELTAQRHRSVVISRPFISPHPTLLSSPATCRLPGASGPLTSLLPSLECSRVQQGISLVQMCALHSRNSPRS